MGKSEFRDWWRSQTTHPSRLQPTVPICPCAACFNGTGHDQEVSANPIDPGEILPPRKSKTTSASIEKKQAPQSNEKQDSAKTTTYVKKPWYKPASRLARKSSRASMASDLAPLCSTSTKNSMSTQRTSIETIQQLA
ncbi:hypothetical protein F5B19DRAFT_441661 [Rostrohypoxylon terebratum]|nr:hypothetical protein F5B19DRAFT_441661 [Rostrohypoxylon terebratum]